MSYISSFHISFVILTYNSYVQKDINKKLCYDMLYVMIRSLEDLDLLDKEFNADNMWSALRTCMGTITEIREYLDSISIGTEPYLEKTKKDKRGGHYRLIRNPWM